MELSSFAPVTSGLNRMGRVLFKGGSAGRWGKLGLSSWLASLCEGGEPYLFVFYGGFFGLSFLLGLPGIDPADPSSPFYSLEAFGNFVNGHMGAILGILLGVTVILFGVYVAWRWITSRGRFMFLRLAIEPDLPVGKAWRETRELGNRYLRFRIYYDFVVGNTYLVIGLVGLGLAMPDILKFEFGGWAIAGIGVWLILALVVSVVFWIFGYLLEYFIVPVMMLDNSMPWAASKAFVRQYFWPNLRAFCVYFLVQLLIGFVLVMCVSAINFVLCNITYLAYVGNVVILPLVLFYRYYNLDYLRQLAPEYVIYPNDPPAQCGFEVMMGNGTGDVRGPG